MCLVWTRQTISDSLFYFFRILRFILFMIYFRLWISSINIIFVIKILWLPVLDVGLKEPRLFNF